MKYLFPSMVLLLVLSNCISTHTESVDTGKDARPVLALDSLYNFSAVERAARRYGPSEVRKGSRLFLKAVNLYRNRHDAAGSIGIFTEAATYYPTARVFFELGNAQSDVHNYDIAVQAYDIAEDLDYRPKYTLRYNMACADALRGDTTGAIGDLQTAFEEGYRNKKQIMNDKDLNNIRNMEDFKILVARYLSNSDVGQKQIFSLMLSAFPKKQLPFSVKGNMEEVYNDKRVINYEYQNFIYGMEESGFGRDVTDEYSYTAQLIKSDTLNMVAFTEKNMLGDTLEPITTMLETYTGQGKPIATLKFACRCTPAQSRTGVVNPDSTIEIKDFANKWQHDPGKENGYRNNKIVSTELKKTTRYKLTPDGHFKEIPAQSKTFTDKDF